MDIHSSEINQQHDATRIKRPRQNVSVTDKSEWITGEEQVDSALSEIDTDNQRARRQPKPMKDDDFAFDQYTSSDCSSSNEESDADEYDSDEDPNKLWCVCQKPHGGKFMICCDVCKDWFHGHCVGVTKLMGDRFEKEGKEWFCGECQEKLRSGIPRNAIPDKEKLKQEKKQQRKSMTREGKRRGRPRKSESSLPTRTSLRNLRKSNSSMVDSTRLKKNLSRTDVRSESFDEFEDSQRLKQLIKERKKEFFYKRQLAEREKLARRNELGLSKSPIMANLSDSLDSLATSTNAPNMNNLPINIKSDKMIAHQKPNIVLQINTKKDSGDHKDARIVTTIVRTPKKNSSNSDPNMDDLFTADPIQVSAKKHKNSPSMQIVANSEASVRKRSNSSSSNSKPEGRLSTDSDTLKSPAKKKRKDSDSSTPNGSNGPNKIDSKSIAQKIKECLSARCTQIADLEVTPESIEKLATEIESQLYDCFAKDSFQKYLTKYRSLIFNLKDAKNQGLVKNVITGEISPAKLVRMSHDEMASHELAKWREMENKHSIELIKRDAELAAQQVIVKKTHKGEEVIAPPLVIKKQEGSTSEVSSVLDTQASPKEQVEPEATSTECSQPKEESNDPTESSEDQPKRFTVSIETNINPDNLSMLREPLIKSEAVADADAESSSQASPNDHSHEERVGEYEDEDEELYDPELNATKSNVVDTTTASPQPIRDTRDCWSGRICMPEIAKFSANAKPVCGELSFMSEELGDSLTVCGRIPPDDVQTYIKKVRSSNKSQILAIQLFPKSEEDETNYSVFFDYLYSRNRYGVVQTNPNVLKDFYIIPLHERSNTPEILKSISGASIDRKKFPNCLIGLLVRSNRKVSTSVYTPTPIN